MIFIIFTAAAASDNKDRFKKMIDENDIKKVRDNFPILARKINGRPLVYLDSAATSQKPRAVIDALVDYYQNHNANIHRGVHTLGDESTRLYEQARETVAEFIGAKDAGELIFTRNTTEAINLVAYSWGLANLTKGDEILLTEMEHHSNIVPWQLVAARQKAKLRFVNVDKEGRLDLQDFRRKLSPRTKLVSVVHVSNFLGTINPIKEIARITKIAKISENREPGLPRSSRWPSGLPRNDASIFRPPTPDPRPLLVVDGAQAVPHMPVNVKDLGCDFYAFSAHKMYGPMGIGCLWGRREILESIPPFLTGGGMINTVSFKQTTFTDLPDKFEAGTPNVAGAVGLEAAVEYLKKIGMENVRRHELELTKYLIASLDSPACRRLERQRLAGRSTPLRSARNDGPTIKIFGPAVAEQRGGLVAFTVKVNGKEVHAHDVAQLLDSEGVAVRSGHHCVMPLHTKLGLSATTRVSFGIYNTKEDIDKLISALKKIPETFS